ncbi:hypothetical protein H9P43_008723 [Blastocladiella emersonii ATCC 22665]|nr:hypothetical protein H9P43_008723 [Blastocladiella emersonii ATCC 22665]
MGSAEPEFFRTQTSTSILLTDPAERFDPFRDSCAADVFLYHNESIDEHHRVICVEEPEHECFDPDCTHSERTTNEVLLNRTSATLYFDSADKVERVVETRTRCEIERIVETNSFFLNTRSGRCPNPTFFGSTSREAKIIALPSTGFFIDVTEERVEQAMASQLSAWLRALAELSTTNPDGIQHRITFVLGDAVLAMEQLTADPAQRFDVVDTSALADRCGNLNLLVHGSPLLKYNNKAAGDRSLLTLCSLKSRMDVDNTLDDNFTIKYKLHTSALPVLFGVALWEEHPLHHDHWAAHTRPFSFNMIKSRATMPYRLCTFFKVDAPDAPVALIVGEPNYLWRAIYGFITSMARHDKLGMYSQGGCFLTPALPVKILAYAFASRRVVWSGGEPYTSLSWPCDDAKALSDDLVDLWFINGEDAERGLYARGYGFDFEFDEYADEAIFQVRATFTLLPGALPTSAIRVYRLEVVGYTYFETIRHSYDASNGTVDVVWYANEHELDPSPNAHFSLFALPALDTRGKFDMKADWIRISDELPCGGVDGNSDATALVVTRVSVEAMQGAVRGIMASAAAAAADSAAARSAARPPPTRLTVVSVMDARREALELELELPRGRGKASVKPVPVADLAPYRGAVALLVDGKVQTLQLPYPGYAARVDVDAKTRRVRVLVLKSANAVVPTLGLRAPIPRFAPFPVPDRGPPVSPFMHAAAMRMLDHLYLPDDAPDRYASISEVPWRGREGAWAAKGLKLLFEQLAEFASKKGGACVLKIYGQGLRGIVALIFVHRPVVIPPQGKAFGLTPALDASYVYVPPLPPKSASPVARANVQRLRKQYEKTENAYARALNLPIPTLRGAGLFSDAVGEYLEYCHAATVDRAIPDIGRFPQTKPGSQGVAAAVAAAFAGFKGELKRALLLPPFPTYFDNQPPPDEDDEECDEGDDEYYYDSEDDEE